MKRNPGAAAVSSELRIIGGTLRGRKIEYDGDPRTRPMKDRVREAVFNLVEPKSKYAIDLFGGTGALGLEAISRGSLGGLFIERHIPTAKIIKRNADALELAERVRVVPGSALVWARRPDAPTSAPWLIFCSPPYEFYVSKQSEMLDLIGRLIAAAPPGSTMVVESDDRFDFALLPQPTSWESRSYPPAVISIFNKV
jgi:16S rRNA (guanine966-N2)-methyltransferase